MVHCLVKSVIICDIYSQYSEFLIQFVKMIQNEDYYIYNHDLNKFSDHFTTPENKVLLTEAVKIGLAIDPF